MSKHVNTYLCLLCREEAEATHRALSRSLKKNWSTSLTHHSMSTWNQCEESFNSATREAFASGCQLLLFAAPAFHFESLLITFLYEFRTVLLTRFLTRAVHYKEAFDVGEVKLTGEFESVFAGTVGIGAVAEEVLENTFVLALYCEGQWGLLGFVADVDGGSVFDELFDDCEIVEADGGEKCVFVV